MDAQAYETSGMLYRDNLNKMLSKMAVCSRHIPIVIVNGREAKLTNVYNRAGRISFVFQSMNTTIETDHTNTLVPTGGTIIDIVQVPSSHGPRHKCAGLVERNVCELDRDTNAAVNILRKHVVGTRPTLATA